MAVYDKSLRIV